MERGEPEIYGRETLADIDARLVALAKSRSHQLTSFQSNAEHALIDRIHAAKAEGVGYIVFNPGAFTHTSIALRDALLGVAVPFVEVHLSNVFSRESFRQRSYLSDIARGVVSGLGARGYEYAVSFAMDALDA